LPRKKGRRFREENTREERAISENYQMRFIGGDYDEGERRNN